ncbi:MAG: hypothetical protein WDM96_13630 [Lacunisphaera sp.]
MATDSGIFYVVQHTVALKQATWETGSQLSLNAGAHLVAAVLAGLALDRRRVAGTVCTATLMLAAAGVLLGHGIANSGVAMLYPRRCPCIPPRWFSIPPVAGGPGLAAVLYGVAGWFGSGLGLATAEQLQRIPVWLPLTSALVVALLLAGRPRR